MNKDDWVGHPYSAWNESNTPPERELWWDTKADNPWRDPADGWKLRELKYLKSALHLGADPNECYALHEAVRELALTSVHALVKHGANINLRDQEGRMPLHCLNEWRGFREAGAAEEMVMKIGAFLIKHGADPRAVDADGNTVLHDLDIKSHKAVDFFIAKGADPAQLNDAGQTPYQRQVARIDERCAAIDSIEANRGKDKSSWWRSTAIQGLSPALKAADEKASLQRMLGRLETAWKPSDCKDSTTEEQQQEQRQETRRRM